MCAETCSRCTCGDTESAFGSMTFVGMSGTCAGALSMISAAVPGGLDAACAMSMTELGTLLTDAYVPPRGSFANVGE
eukprot:6066147-Prymnesium_polylepis.1